MPRHAPTATVEQVHAWLRTNPGPHSAAAIAQALHCSTSTVGRRLEPLVASGAVSRTGGTSGRYVRWEAVA